MEDHPTTVADDDRPPGLSSHRYADEALHQGAGVSVLTYFRRGDPARPLIVFVPGGGHLARIAYGHPGADPRDFLDHWLGRAGYGLLALSYPSDHPATGPVQPDMTSTRWAIAIAEVTKAVVDRHSLSPTIVLAGWSMGGKVVPVFARHAARIGLTLTCFLSLAATPPIPGLGNHAPGGERLTEQGLWDSGAPLRDGRSRRQLWQAELDDRSRRAGRCAIPPEIYQHDYLCGTPIRLRGQVPRDGAGPPIDDPGAAVGDLATTDFTAHPIVATIVPTDAPDAAHALTDRAAWALFSLRGLYQRHLAATGTNPTELPDTAWRALLALFRAIPDTLSRDAEGGHFFFVGEPGAKATAGHMADLIAAAAEATRRIAELTAPPAVRRCPGDGR